MERVKKETTLTKENPEYKVKLNKAKPQHSKMKLIIKDLWLAQAKRFFKIENK